MDFFSFTNLIKFYLFVSVTLKWFNYAEGRHIHNFLYTIHLFSDVGFHFEGYE